MKAAYPPAPASESSTNISAQTGVRRFIFRSEYGAPESGSGFSSSSRSARTGSSSTLRATVGRAWIAGALGLDFSDACSRAGAGAAALAETNEVFELLIALALG